MNREDIKTLLILFLLLVGTILAFKYRANEKQENACKYEIETFYDEDESAKFIILKDKLGDVIYCERVNEWKENR